MNQFLKLAYDHGAQQAIADLEKEAGIYVTGPEGIMQQINKIRETSARLGMPDLPSVASLQKFDIKDLFRMNRNLMADLEGNRLSNSSEWSRLMRTSAPDEPIHLLTRK